MRAGPAEGHSLGSGRAGTSDNINIRAPSNGGGDEHDFSAPRDGTVYAYDHAWGHARGWMAVEPVVIDLRQGRGGGETRCPLRTGVGELLVVVSKGMPQNWKKTVHYGRVARYFYVNMNVIGRATV